MRITEEMVARVGLNTIRKHKEDLAYLQDVVSSGLRVSKPGDDPGVAATIAQTRQALDRVERHGQRVGTVRSSLLFQDDLLSQANQILVRAKEIGTQGANASNSVETRAALAEEMFHLRDQLVQIANSQYLGKYVYGGADDDDPPFDPDTYNNPATGAASERYVFDAEDGTTVTRTVNITDSMSVRVNTAGDQVFEDSIAALERMGRALAGYRTEPTDANGIPNGTPDGSGSAFVFPSADAYLEQTEDILSALDLIDTAREGDIMVETSSVAGRLTRLDTADSVLFSFSENLTRVLDRVQNADQVEAISLLTEAQASLERSLAVTSRIQQGSLLDFL